MVIGKRIRKLLTSTQRDLIVAMIRAKRPQTTYKLSKRSHRSWKAAKDNLEILKKKKVVRMKKKNKVSKWTLK